MMAEGEFVRGNFGRSPGQSARADTVKLPNIAEDDLSREERIDISVQNITGYQSLIDSGELDPGQKRAYEDSIGNTLDLLSPDEQEEVLSKIDQTKIREFRKE